MKFRPYVEPLEPMRGLEIPPEVVDALGRGKRPPVTITINGHSWESRVAIMRGRYLLGLSNANRQAAGVVTGDEIEVEVDIDAEPRVVAEPTSPVPWTPTRSPDEVQGSTTVALIAVWASPLSVETSPLRR
jgi:hypothetical protein